ncbi:MAG TPA: hypothetical protein VGN95_12845, partial [Pyrinomonadaceae bacterium]|nr:hypothetical protein [Pyrinomonadaceae bacterium]
MSTRHVAVTPCSFRPAFKFLLIITVLLLGMQATQAATIVVVAGGNLQSAVNAAQPGDTILLEAGASFTGPISLPNKAGSSFITIQSSALSSLPAAGQRVSPAHAPLMPKILSPQNSSAILTDDSAHHFRFIGIEFAPAAGYVYNLVNLGRDDFSSLSQVPHHLEFDRCYLHAPGLNRVRRGFALNASEVSVSNSYVSGFAGAQDETQAIACWNGPGPLHIVNNYLEAGAETILIGGSDPSIQNMVPSDIEIRGNYLTKALAWRGQATIKTVLELKNARRVTVTGNVIERGMDCSAMTLTVRNQNGGAPWSVIEDVEVRSNVFRSAGSGINI